MLLAESVPSHALSGCRAFGSAGWGAGGAAGGRGSGSVVCAGTGDATSIASPSGGMVKLAVRAGIESAPEGNKAEGSREGRRVDDAGAGVSMTPGGARGAPPGQALESGAAATGGGDGKGQKT